MRAIQQVAFGGPEVLSLVELPVPEPAEGEVLIRVACAGVNFADTHAREGRYLAPTALPFVPGGEVAGVVEGTGRRVVALCGAGGYAEYATAPAGRVFDVPEGVGDAAALALLGQGLTAWHLYRTAARLAPGETVVVISGAGGVGSLAVQLGRALGAGRVIATASTPAKRELCLELGADAAVDGRADGLTDRLVEANLGEPVDVVLESAGGAVFDGALRAVAPFGRCVVHGIASKEAASVRTSTLLRGSRSVVGFWLAHCLERPAMVDEALHDLAGRVADGTLRVVIGATYPLRDAARAQKDLAARRTTGKLVLDVADVG